MPTHRCRRVMDDGLDRVPGWRRFEIVFSFELVPLEFADAPDEDSYVERRDVRLTIDGPAFCQGGVPSGAQDKMRVLYWHAHRALEDGNTTLHVDLEYAHKHRVDPSKISYPATGPFDIRLKQKMGFR